MQLQYPVPQWTLKQKNLLSSLWVMRLMSRRPSSSFNTERDSVHNCTLTVMLIAVTFKKVNMNIPWLRWGPRSRSDWWRALETCKGRRKPSEWWACSDRWSGLEAEIQHQLVRHNKITKSGDNEQSVRCIPGRGVASAASRSGWRRARECWRPGSYSRLSNVCQAEDWGIQRESQVTGVSSSQPQLTSFSEKINYLSAWKWKL